MKNTIPTFVLFTLFACFLPAVATAAAYLKIGDIKGEALDKGSSSEVHTLRWMAPESIHEKRTSRAAQSSGGALSITKPIDKSSPMLARSLSSGGSIDEMAIADGEKQYLLKGVQVVSVEKKGKQETVTMKFQHREEFGQIRAASANHNSTRSNRLAPAQPNSNTAPATDYNSSRSNRQR